MHLKTILAICGSTRAGSTNHALIQAISGLKKDQLHIVLFDGIQSLPHFNPDIDLDDPPTAVVAFRNQIKAADGILICTPEYAMGVPGSLKNAIDWIVSSCEFNHKPTALITASSMGEKGHASLLETLKIIEARIVEETQLVISFAKTKVHSDGMITDEVTRLKVLAVMHALEEIINN